MIGHVMNKRFADQLAHCECCPRKCGVNRLAGQTGFCRIAAGAQVAHAGLHHGEEPPISGTRGSGTIFFSGCNLRCVFCQNADISQKDNGEEVSAAQLAGMMIELQQQGCHNINLVSPSHVVPQILESLAIAVDRGLQLPLVYNSGGYDSESELRLLDGIVDVYMPDLKLLEIEAARRYLKAPDYPAVAKAALREMHRQVGVLELDSDGLARRGVLVRHLVMPGLLADTEQAMKFLAKELSPDTYVNLLAQYWPTWKSHDYPEIDRAIRPREYARAIELARQAGLHRLD